jgi:hypothetical protein
VAFGGAARREVTTMGNQVEKMKVTKRTEVVTIKMTKIHSMTTVLGVAEMRLTPFLKSLRGVMHSQRLVKVTTRQGTLA